MMKKRSNRNSERRVAATKEEETGIHRFRRLAQILGKKKKEKHSSPQMHTDRHRLGRRGVFNHGEHPARRGTICKRNHLLAVDPLFAPSAPLR